MTTYPLEALAPLAERLRSMAARRLELDADDIILASRFAFDNGDRFASSRAAIMAASVSEGVCKPNKITEQRLNECAAQVEEYIGRLQRGEVQL